MTEGNIRMSTAADGQRMVEIWRDAVDATHDFLSPADREAIEADVSGFLPHAPAWLWIDRHGTPRAFMILTGSRMEALFIDPGFHRQGIGRQLVEYALSNEPILTTEVNEQNWGARSFYEKMGFRPIGWSALDEQGRPYPLIHLRLKR